MSRKATILVVDDDPESLRLLANMLASGGYQVRRADSGKLAIEYIGSAIPELIVLDVRMPEMDGFEVCRRLKEKPQTAAIPVMFISGARDPEERVNGLALGAVDFVAKPLVREELLARVHTHVELGHLRRDLEQQIALKTAELHDTVAALRHEIAERAVAENALRDSQQQFWILADTAPVLIWASGTDSRHTFFNRQWLDFTGRTIDQELGDGWRDGIHPDDVERCLAAYTSAFDAHRKFQIEYRLRRADGTYRWMLDTGAPRFDTGGVFAGYVGSCIDITDRKHADERAFERERLQRMRILTGGIAHDFTNIMSTILANADLAEAELSDGNSPRDEIEDIKALANRAVEIVRELTTYGSQNKGQFQPVHVSQLVQEMLALLKTSISRRAILKATWPENEPAVWENPVHLRQIVMNLTMNASEALGGKDGVINISVSRITRTGDVDSTCGSGSGEYLRLVVSDTGCGIAKDQRARIFDPYFTTKRTGHGLGLAVVHGIVQSHHGAINVASTVGVGTTVEVLLPYLEVRSADHVSSAATEVSAACGY